MTLILIEERQKMPGGANAVLSFDHGAHYPITVSDPFSEQQEQELEWYFEEHLAFPFTNQVKAQRAASSIIDYGETLFQQIFADHQAYAAYSECGKAGLRTLQFEIAGSPEFHSLHWEALKDPRLPQPLTLQATMIRKNLVPQLMPATNRPSPTINVLAITARPWGRQDVGYRTISRPLVEELRQARLRVQVDILRPGTYKALDNHLREITNKYGVGYYHVIHFDVHGALMEYEQIQQNQETSRYFYQQRYGRADIQPYEGARAFLFLENEQDGMADPVEAKELGDLLLSHQIPIAILNACQSGKQIGASETSLGSRLIQAGVQVVLAMGYSVTVSAAELLIRVLYKQLFAGNKLADAICTARQELYNSKDRLVYYNQSLDLEDWLLPVVYQNQPQQLHMQTLTAEEAAAIYEKRAARYESAQPAYGFVGRDLDILQIEKRLLTRGNILLVRGMGGAGKTTLLHHLGTWWQTTGLVEQVFYFGYDERAWTRQQIITAIAKQLMSKVQYLTEFQPFSLEAQQGLLTTRLRAERHLLLLDNLESITGSELAIHHPLAKKEQDALRSLLVELAGGQTLVLLGSRGREDWLARETFVDNMHDLPGLDPEAASMLADRILTRQDAIKYRQDEDLRHLLKLLDGFPLALEVVLANLTRQTPTQVLAALKAGNVQQLDQGDSQKKTESILQCIDYSHRNFTPEAQALLLCLAPFTSIINQNFLDAYTAQLKQHSQLAALPFERWGELLKEAMNWGLLTIDRDVPTILHLQPILPYFLRTRLSTPEQGEIKDAIDAAFQVHYNTVSKTLRNLLDAKEPQQRQVGTILMRLEYENIMTALQFALKAHSSVLSFQDALSRYLVAVQDKERMLELNLIVLDGLKGYPATMWIDQNAWELFAAIGNVAYQQQQLRQYTSAEEAYQRVLKFAREGSGLDEKVSGTLRATTYLNLGLLAQEQQKWGEAEKYYKQALQIKTDSNERYGQAKTYHNLGILAQEQRKLEQAEQYYQQALQIRVDSDDRYEQAESYGQLGRLAQEQRKLELAEQYYQQALQIQTDFNDRYGQAKTYQNLGVVAQMRRAWEQAEKYYQQALQIQIDSNDRHAQAPIYHNLGVIAQETGEWEQAEQYYKQALQIKVDYNDRYAQAATYHQLSMVAEERQEWKQAEQYCRQALQIRIDSDDRYGQASAYHQLGCLALDQRNWVQARGFLLQALEIFIAYKDSYSSGITMNYLAELWQKSGDTTLPAAIASILHVSQREAEKLLQERRGAKGR